MNLNKKEKKYKELLACDRELDELYRQKWAIEPKKLDEPIFHGYVRYLQIRPENRLRGDYEQIKNAFKLVGSHKAYHKTKDFTIKHKDHIQEKHATLSFFLDPRFRYYISEQKQLIDFQHIYECGGHLKHVQHVVECNCSFDKHPNHFKPHYEFSKPWLLEEKTEAYWLTHYTPIDTDLESKIDKLKKVMYENNFYEILYGKHKHDLCGHYPYLKDKTHGYLHGYPRPRIEELYEW